MSDPTFTHNCSICGEAYASREQFPAHQVCPRCMGATAESVAKPARSPDDREKRKKEKRKEKQAKKARRKNRRK